MIKVAASRHNKMYQPLFTENSFLVLNVVLLLASILTKKEKEIGKCVAIWVHNFFGAAPMDKLWAWSWKRWLSSFIGFRINPFQSTNEKKITNKPTNPIE